ncbi:MAG: hypothetical protein HQL36_02265 [Alphaproteobacteria bacterium]|nr:hypothetical protein [Alphaproteobacteria bacterium]
MSIDKKEQEAFQALLNRASTNVIIKRLNDNVIARLWKRDLAKEELERRKGESDAREATEKKRLHSASLKGWFWTAILLVVVVTGAVVILMT